MRVEVAAFRGVVGIRLVAHRGWHTARRLCAARPPIPGNESIINKANASMWPPGRSISQHNGNMTKPLARRENSTNRSKPDPLNGTLLRGAHWRLVR